MDNYSKFSFAYNSKSGKLFFYNTLSGAILSLEKEESDIFIKNKTKDKRFKEIENFLLDNHVLVNPNILKIQDDSLKVKQDIFFNDNGSFLNLCIVTSLQCNMMCPYCYEHQEDILLTKKDYDRIFKYLTHQADAKLINISWFGGEPLVNVDFILHFLKNINNYVNEKNINFSSHMTTNGTLLNRQLFDVLVSLGVRTFQITLDGAKDDNDKTRLLKNRNSSFDTILNNLLEIKKSTDYFKIVIRCNVDKNTNIKMFLDMYKKYFSNDDRFRCLLFPISKWGKGSYASDNNCDIITQDLFTLNTVVLEQKLQSDLLDTVLSGNLFCEYGFPFKFVVNPNGSIGNCTLSFDNIYGDSIESICTKHNFTRNPKCDKKDCFLYPKCFGYYCKNETRSAVQCNKMIRDVKNFIGVYFDEFC